MAPRSEVRLNSKLGTGSGPGSLSPSHEIKGIPGPPCLHWFFPMLCGTVPGNLLKATGPSVQSDRATHLFPVLVGWEKNNGIHCKTATQGGCTKGLRSRVCWEAQSYGHFFHCIVFITQQANTASLERSCVFLQD